MWRFGYMHLPSLSPSFQLGLALHCQMMDGNLALWLDCSFYIEMTSCAGSNIELMP